MSGGENPKGLRLDKWLWAARFFKTRQLAVEAISGGRVHLNGQRTKPGKEVKPGNRLEIHKESLSWDIEVKVIPRQRRPASEAVTFYEELEESILRRQKMVDEQQLLRAASPKQESGRPSKRDRRMIHRFTSKE